MTRRIPASGSGKARPRRLAGLPARAGAVLLAAGLLLGATGCATARKTPPPPPVPASRSVVTVPPAAAQPLPPLPGPKSEPPPPAVVPSPAPPSAPEPPPLVAEVAMRIESTPSGATIVVDGKPVGKTPLQLSVGVTNQGFFRDYVEIRARFVATDETEVSRTAMVEFSPREKVPAVLEFTPDGAQRTVR